MNPPKESELEAFKRMCGHDIHLFPVWQAACKWQRQQDAKLLDISTQEILLMGGEMTAQELRTVKAMLSNRKTNIINE
jgi:hypothetical protein